MATGPDCICPICCEVPEDIAYVMSCHHQFCLSCIVHWAKKNPSCPLCRRPVHALIYSVHVNQEFLEIIFPQPSSMLIAELQAEQEAAGSVPTTYVAGFPPKTWALLFRNYAMILEPVQLWLNEVLLAECWWDAALAQGRILSYLCCYGLDEELLIRELQPLLREQTERFVRELIGVAMEYCYERIQLVMNAQSSHAAQGQGDTTRDPDAAPAEEMAASNASTLEEFPEELEQVVEDTFNSGQSSSQGQA